MKTNIKAALLAVGLIGMSVPAMANRVVRHETVNGHAARTVTTESTTYTNIYETEADAIRRRQAAIDRANFFQPCTGNPDRNCYHVYNEWPGSDVIGQRAVTKSTTVSKY